jgi:hypothetical protein
LSFPPASRNSRAGGQKPAALRAFGQWLGNVFKTRNERVMFVKGGPGVDSGDAAAVFGVASGGGINKVRLIR